MTTDVMALNALAPGRDLDAYVQTISAFPVLTPEQEKVLAERFYYENDLEAARELVLCHLRFVVHLARSYRGYGLQEADLIFVFDLSAQELIECTQRINERNISKW